MSKTFRYVDLPNMAYITQGLTFNVLRCAEVLDAFLIGLDEVVEQISSEKWDEQVFRTGERD